MNSSFSIKEAFSYGWETFKKQWKSLLPYFAVLIIIQVVFSYLGGEKSPVGLTGAMVINLLGTVVSIFLSASMIKTILMVNNHHTISISKNIFCATRKETWRYFKTGLVFALYLLPAFIPLAIIGGLFAVVITTSPALLPVMILVVIAAVVAVVFYVSSLFFSYYISFEHNFKIFENVRYSLKITKGNRWKLVYFSVISFLLILLGFVCFFVGIMITIPIVQLATVYVYKKLDAQYQAKEGKTESTSEATTVHIHAETVTDVEIQPEEITASKEDIKE